MPSDIVGRIFQKLIGPDERHRYGQHFTGDDVVDLINGFCIRAGGDTILDPACGSGSFLVRAYYRKRHLDARRPHLNLIGELFGCDIAPYPAHLATLNLAAREINEEATDESDGDYEADSGEAEATETGFATGVFGHEPQEYRAGKWGRYVRAPDIYFDIMRRFGQRFVALGEVASIRRGVTSGCDAFFMPKDVTADVLAKHETDRAFRENCGGAPRKDVVSGKLRIIKAGDGSVHPIEAGYVKPEVHSLMNVQRPTIHAADIDRFILLVREPLDELKAKAPWAWRYIRYGMTATFPSKKAKPGPVHTRPTCAARDPWYDLTAIAKPAFAFWPKGQQYRHMVIANPHGFPCNCRLYEMQANAEYDTLAFAAILNCTLVALWRNFYGRYTGTEGALETMVLDARLMEVPTPIGATANVCERLKDAFVRQGHRI